ncbi:hypothetical protein WHR41_02852 [Cladosporium halotolerans]|uniref:Uncharacterized protein n=1 Tax=Cladosporium halotolerans TaxID=1052096 RepID=A0AB34KTK1_9PEZI
MKYTGLKQMLAIGFLALATASPHPNPQTQDPIDPNPSLTFSLRNPTITNFSTQANSTAFTTPPRTSSIPTTSTSSPTLTALASFTAPNGGQYDATALDGTLRIAGYTLTPGGPDALVGGVRVSAGESGLVHGGTTAAYQTVTAEASATSGQGRSTVESTTEVQASATTASGGESASESATGSGSESESASAAATGGAAVAVARSRGAVVALGGIAGMLCVFG